MVAHHHISRYPHPLLAVRPADCTRVLTRCDFALTDMRGIEGQIRRFDHARRARASPGLKVGGQDAIIFALSWAHQSKIIGVFLSILSHDWLLSFTIAPWVCKG